MIALTTLTFSALSWAALGTSLANHLWQSTVFAVVVWFLTLLRRDALFALARRIGEFRASFLLADWLGEPHRVAQGSSNSSIPIRGDTRAQRAL